MTLTTTASAPGYQPVSKEVSGTVAELTAALLAQPTTSDVPVTVQFTDQSNGDPGIESWLWDFGDGLKSAEQHPSHFYESGSYTVSLTIGYKTRSVTIKKENYIKVAVAPPPQVSAITPAQGWRSAQTQVSLTGSDFIDTPHVALYGGGPRIESSLNTEGSAWDVHILNNHAYVVDRNGTFHVIDVSDPSNPSLIGSKQVSGQLFDVFVSGAYVYVAALDAGLQIIDIADPQNLSIVGIGDALGQAEGVHVLGEHAFVTSYLGDGIAALQVFDISNPAAPDLVGSNDELQSAGPIFVSGEYAYVSGSTGGIQVVDVSDPTHPSVVASLNLPGRAKDIYVVGNYAYVPCNTSDFHVVDVTNPAAPTLAGSCDIPRAVGVYVDGVYAYVCGGSVLGTNSLCVVDVRNPANPTLVGSVNIPGDPERVFAAGGYAYVAAGGTGLHIVDVAYPANPSLQGSAGMDAYGEASGIAISGDYAFLTLYGSSGGLEVMDVSDPSNPRTVEYVNTPGYAQDVFVSENYAFVADNHKGLRIYDISDPKQVTPAGHIVLPDQVHALGVYASGDFAYVAASTSGLYVIDVGNPAEPDIVGSIDTEGGLTRNVYVVNNFAYVADGNPGLQVIDVSEPTTPTLVCTVDTRGYAYDVHVAGNYAYVADYHRGLQIIDISEPTNASRAGSCDTPGLALGVHVSGSHAYIAGNDSGVHVVDVSEPARASLVGSCDTPGRALEVCVSGSHVYVADGAPPTLELTKPGSGLRVIEKLIPATGVGLLNENQITATIPAGLRPGVYDLYTVNPNSTPDVMYHGYTVKGTDFKGYPTSGPVPLTVQFTDRSVGSTALLWNFGDGATSTAQNPSHVFTTETGFTVSLAVTGSDGEDTEVKENYIRPFEYVAPTIDRIKGVKEPGKVIRIIGSGFGETQGTSRLFIGLKVFQEDNKRIKLWTDTKRFDCRNAVAVGLRGKILGGKKYGYRFTNLWPSQAISNESK